MKTLSGDLRYPGDVVPWPPPNAEEIEAVGRAEPRHYSRRQAIISLASAASLIFAGAKIDGVFTSEYWGNETTNIRPVAGAESLASNNTEWVVFGGFGQRDSSNAAQQFFNAIGGNEAVSRVKYPSQYFKIEAPAETLAQYINERGMRQLNIIGVSMGLPLALVTLKSIVDNNLIKQNQMPKIGYVAAYSSPFDIEDAISGTVAHDIAQTSKLLRYKGEIIGKLLFCLAEEQARIQNMPTKSRPGILKRFFDSTRQTFNNSPPGMDVAMFEVLDQFGRVFSQPQSQSNILAGANFGYFKSGLPDGTVNDQASYDKYKAVFERSLSSIDIMSIGDRGHADTVYSADAAARWYRKLIATSAIT